MDEKNYREEHMKYFFLLEKIVNGRPLYIHKENYRTTNDPWQAQRFPSESSAMEYVSKESLVGQGYIPVVHGFI